MSQKRGWIRSSVVAGVVGVFAGGMVIFLLELGGHAVLGTADPADPSTITTPMFASVLFAWIVGSATAGAVSTRWARSASLGPGIAVGLVLLAAAISNIIAFPHPLWMVVAAVLLMPLAAVLSARAVAGTARA